MDTEELKTVRPAIKKCPYCGEVLPPLTKVCPSCGQIAEGSNGHNNVASMMRDINDVCKKYANATIKFYDFILLLTPIIYLLWIIGAIIKIVRSNKLYNTFISLSSQAKLQYGANHDFQSYLSSKTTEIEDMKRKNKTLQVAVYILILIDITLISVYLMN